MLFRYMYALVFFVCLILGQNATAQIYGYVGAPGSNSIKGWACDYQENTSIWVHVYLNGPAGQGGVFFKSFRTASQSESAIHNICKTSGSVKHRFHIPLTNAEMQAHKGKRIYIHGISSNHPNRLINKSGDYRIPAPDIAIKGNVESVQRTEDGLRVRGWACQKSVSQSTNVHVYSQQSRTFLGSFPANRSRENAVKTACLSNINAHGFEFVIPNSRLRSVRGQTLNVHGIRLTGTVPNSILSNSTNHKLPTQLLYRLSDLDASNPLDLTIDKDSVRINKSIDLRHIRIINGGILRCATGDTREFTLRTAGIKIMGAGSTLLCGWNSSRYQGRLNIKLKKGHPMDGSEAGIMAMMGGRIILHGKNVGTRWTRLNGHANKNATRIRMVHAVNWSVGDTIAIGSTSYNMWQSEVRRVTAIDADKKGVTLNAPLQHFHRGWGYSSGGKWINLKAEVINLNRNIKIHPDGSASSLDSSKIGGHIMVMEGGKAYIKAVQLNRMGQMGRMGRYPFHWHKAGNVAPQNQYFMDSSIIGSYQRCVTVHGTHGARVQNNVCYDHFGHGYFLEDGNETNNKFYYNVGMRSKRTPADKTLLISDNRSSQRQRFDAPATFWISNPKNEFVGNVASGSQGTGFWNAFVPFLYCDTAGDSHGCEVKQNATGANVFPAYERTLRFDGNVAHSANVGFNWDGAPWGARTNNPRNPEDRQLRSSHYHNKGYGNSNGPMPVFNNLHAYKNIYTGVYYRGNKSLFRNYRSADNGVHLFIAFSQVFENALIVGDTGQPQSEKDYQLSKTVWPYGHSIGFVTYDGPTTLDKVHFAGFPSTKTYATNGREITPVPIHLFGGASHYEQQMIDLSFAGNPYYKVKFDPTHVNWDDAVNHVRVRDVTGSIYGRVNELIVADTEISDDPSCRVLHSGRAQALGCNYDMGTLHHGWADVAAGVEKNRINFSYHRIGGPGGNADFLGKPAGDNSLYNKAGLILNKGYRYQFFYDDNLVINPGFMLEAKNYRMRSPVLSFPAYKNCSVVNASNVGSMSNLNSYTGSGNAYFRDSSGTPHVRLTAINLRVYTGTYQSGPIKLMCP